MKVLLGAAERNEKKGRDREGGRERKERYVIRRKVELE